ncbi:MAG: sugar phosphate isomerase/epimerase family protein [Thermomicrobiales bacterium]
MRLSIITDEITQDFAHALDVCEELGVRTVELRAVDGSNVVSHDQASLTKIKAQLEERGFDVRGIASPFLKCHIRGDGAPAGATHGAAPSSREEQWEVLEQSFRVADLFGAPLVRTFSYWRAPDPESVRDETLEVLAEATRRTEAAGFILGLENEHACNIGTGAESAWYLERIPSPTFGMIWDPGNEAALGSTPYPNGYEHVRGRIAHVHLKDRDASGRWVRMGDGIIDWVGQLRHLAADGYDGPLSLETHYRTPDGGSEAASRESLIALRRLCDEAGVTLDG